MIDNENIKIVDKDTVSYYTYIIKRNGTITTSEGKEVRKQNLHYQHSHISLNINGKSCKKNVARLIYSLFYEVDSNEPALSSKKSMLFFKDNDTTNVSYDNLEVVSRKEGFKRTGKTPLRDDKTGDFQKRFSEKEVEIIQKEYHSKSDEKNINQFKKQKPSIRELAKKYDCSASSIAKIVKGKY